MTNNSLCSLAFNYEGEDYIVPGLHLIQADLTRKFEANTGMGLAYRQYIEDSGAKSYSLELSCILRDNPAHKALLQIANNNKAHLFTLSLGNKLNLSGPFLIYKFHLRTNKSGHLTMQLNFESNGEIKNGL